VIEQLTADKLKLTEELSESNDQTIKATEIRVIAEGEATRLKSIIKAIEMDKQMLHQQVQKLTDLVEYFDKTTTQSVDDFIHRLKLDLNLFAEG
jgi:hypothetical protein